MAGTASQMLPTTRINPERTRFQNHGAQTNDAFADAMVANFPQDPSLLQRRNGYAQILTQQGMPIEQAMAEAEQAIPDASPVTPGPGSQLPPISAPADLGALGRNGDTMVAHINPQEAALLKRSGGSGTINPITRLPEFYERADSRDRGPGSGNKGNSGGSARTGGNSGGGSQLLGTKKSGLTDKDILSPEGWGSNADLTGPTIERVQRSEPFAPSGANQRWGLTPGTAPDVQQKQDDYNSAWDDHLNRGFGGWLGDKLKDMVPGFRQELPNWNDPASFKNGIYHDSWSPWGAAASIVGMAAPIPGVSMGTGLIGNQLADELGGDRYVFGGGGWGEAVDAPGKAVNPQADAKAAALKGDGPPANERTATGGLLPPIAGNPAPSTAMNTAPAASPGSALPPMIAPNPNPNLKPGGYQPIGGPSPYGWMLPSWRYT